MIGLSHILVPHWTVYPCQVCVSPRQLLYIQVAAVAYQKLSFKTSAWVVFT